MQYQLKFARVNADADGDNTLIAAVSGKKFRILGYHFIQGGTAGLLVVRSGATILFEFTAAIGSLGFTGSFEAPAFETAVGEALILNNAAAQDVNGHLTYVEL